MQAACEAGDVFAWLEGGGGGAGGAGDALCALFASVREPWLVRALLHYHARTGSERALALLTRAPEHHARHALDALAEQLRGERAARHHALAALAPLLARRPPWLHLLLPPSTVPRELVRCARREREPAPLLHALLALAALLPAQPALTPAHCDHLAEALTRDPLDLEEGCSSAHLQLGARAVFLAAYATHPCTLVEALRGAGAGAGGGEAWQRAVERLARGVALHPALVTGSRRAEADAQRYQRDQPHDVLAECARLVLPAPAPAPARDEPASPAPECRSSPAPLPGSATQAERERERARARSAGAVAVRPGGAGWFVLGEVSGAEAAPHTPLPERERERGEPEPEPEPAVEATPENTPARLARQAFRFPPPDSAAVRPLLTRTPPAPPALGDACAARLQRVQSERRAHHSPVPIGAAPPPPGAARPRPRHADTDTDDTEVRELTSRALPLAVGGWVEAEGLLPAPVGLLGARRRGALARGGAGGGSAHRAASCGPRLGGRHGVHAAVQTVDAWPEPYEFLLADCAPTLPPDAARHLDKQNSTSKESSTKFAHSEVVDPTERLDRYLADLYAGSGAGAGAGAGAQAELAEQLALAHAQLMYERWRRDAHAERNRRLLGRCRSVRALELDNAALQARVRDLAAERDRLREAALAARRPLEPDVAARAAVAALERDLAAERGARLRAEAALADAAAGRERDAAELQRMRADSFEAARHVEALARAALAAERRAEHVRRLRRELLLLAERELRLEEAVRGAGEAGGGRAGDEGTERALRAACARAEAEAEAAGARAEAAVARAHELEALGASRDACAAELKRAARVEAEEGAARLRALHDKYRALQRIVRAAAAAQLQRAAREVRTNCG